MDGHFKDPELCRFPASEYAITSPCKKCGKFVTMGFKVNRPGTARCCYDGKTYHRFCSPKCAVDFGMGEFL